MNAIKEGLESGEYNKDDLISVLTEQLTGGKGEGIDLSGLFGGMSLDGLLPEDFNITSLVDKIFGGIEQGNLDLTKVQQLGGFLTDGIGSGMLANLSSLTDAITGGDGIVPFVINLLTGGFSVNSPSKVTEEIGGYLTEGLAVGITNTTSKIIRAMTHVVSLTLSVIQNRLNDFETAGNDSGAAYATGVSNQTSLARIAAEMLSLAAEWAIRLAISDAEDLGEDWGKGYVNGVESQVDEARAAGRKLGEATEQGYREVTQTRSPSRVAMRLGNYWGLGYITGLEEYIDKAGRVGRELGDKTLDALKTPMMLINDVLNADLDSSPVITPVLDLKNIQNGARAINGMIPSEARSLGYISYSMRNRNQTSNADIVSAIMGMSGKMDNARGGDTYNINGITYDDGSNIVDAVQTLVRAARVERRR